MAANRWSSKKQDCTWPRAKCDGASTGLAGEQHRHGCVVFGTVSSNYSHVAVHPSHFAGGITSKHRGGVSTSRRLLASTGGTRACLPLQGSLCPVPHLPRPLLSAHAHPFVAADPLAPLDNGCLSNGQHARVDIVEHTHIALCSLLMLTSPSDDSDEAGVLCRASRSPCPECEHMHVEVEPSLRPTVALSSLLLVQPSSRRSSGWSVGPSVRPSVRLPCMSICPSVRPSLRSPAGRPACPPHVCPIYILQRSLCLTCLPFLQASIDQESARTCSSSTFN